jgi:hypothetical protein
MLTVMPEARSYQVVELNSRTDVSFSALKSDRDLPRESGIAKFIND